MAATAAAGVALALPQLGCGDGESIDASVVVVGAGLAGLVAADELSRQGFEVTVVEARERIGGRVHTVREPFAEGQYAEAGGEYLDTVHTDMLDLVERFGLELDDLNEVGSDKPGVILAGGERFVNEESLIAAAQGEIDAFYDEVATLAEDVEPSELDRRSVGELLDELDPGEEARFLLEHQIRDSYAVDPSRLSLLFLTLAETAYADAPEDGIETLRIRGGNDQLPRALADELDGDVRLSAPVTSISQDASGVRVVAGGSEVAADYAVLAVPLDPLSAVEFSPPLSAEDRAAAAQIQYGAATKTMLQYRRRVWRESSNGEAFTDLPAGDLWEATGAQPGTAGILIAFSAGGLGLATAGLELAARIQQAARDVDQVYPGSAKAFSTAASLAWSNQPYSGGCYVAPAPGQALALAEETWEPIDRLHFAGDHTDKQFPGYMEGAVRSGRRAARQIIER